jgi:hypothetical protein
MNIFERPVPVEKDSRFPLADREVYKKGEIWIELPSGTKWADRNIGATSVTSVGGYYSYGETASKDAGTAVRLRSKNLRIPESEYGGFQLAATSWRGTCSKIPTSRLTPCYC